MEEKERYLSCFFCQGTIRTIYRQETRTHKGDHYCSDTEYTINVLIPAETDLVRIKFKPNYEGKLKELMAEAEEEVGKIIDSAILKANNVLKPYNDRLGNKNQIVPTIPHYGMYSLEEDREKAANKVYGLREWVEYPKEEGVDEIKLGSGFNEGKLLASKDCVKDSLTLEGVVNNPILKQKFKEELKQLPEPMRNIYDKLKQEKITIKTEPFDFRRSI